MKFTLSWLKEHLQADAGLDAIVDALTRIGLEVEGVEDPAAFLLRRAPAPVFAEGHRAEAQLRDPQAGLAE